MSDPTNVDRRITLKWMAGAMAATGLPLDGAYGQPNTVVAPWTAVDAPPVTGKGYGTDPTLLEPVGPWPQTLTAAGVVFGQAGSTGAAGATGAAA